MHSRDEHLAPAPRRPFGLPYAIVVRLLVGTVIALTWDVTGRADDVARPTVGDTASAGVLAAVPARGLAAAVAEAGRIEVPSVDPGERLSIRATQAARWTEGSYDVWHLTGGVTIAQGVTEAKSHEAVVWIEQAGVIPETDDEAEPAPRPRGLLVRMAGEVTVTSASAGSAAPPSTVRGSRWTGRFWTIHDPALEESCL